MESVFKHSVAHTNNLKVLLAAASEVGKHTHTQWTAPRSIPTRLFTLFAPADV